MKEGLEVREEGNVGLVGERIEEDSELLSKPLNQGYLVPKPKMLLLLYRLRPKLNTLAAETTIKQMMPRPTNAKLICAGGAGYPVV